MNILSIYIGYIIDLIIGDPYSFPHPVRFIGKLIKITEDRIRKVAKNDKALNRWIYSMVYYIWSNLFCYIFNS